LTALSTATQNTIGDLALFDRTLHKRHKKLKREVSVPKLFQDVFKRLNHEPTVRSGSTCVSSALKLYGVLTLASPYSLT